MLPDWLVFLLALSGVAALFGLLFAGRGRYKTEWRCEWRGRQLRLVALTHLKELWVDSAVVADQLTREDIDVDLVTLIDGVFVLGRIRHIGPGRSCGRFYADGVWIGGDPPDAGEQVLTTEAPR